MEAYRKAYGYYPERMLAETIYRTRENLRYCKEHGIHLNVLRPGKPLKDSAIREQELHLEWLESGERSDIERRSESASGAVPWDRSSLSKEDGGQMYFSVLLY